MGLTFSNNLFSTLCRRLFGIGSSHKLHLHNSICENKTSRTNTNNIIPKRSWDKRGIFILILFTFWCHLSILCKLLVVLHLFMFSRVLLSFSRQLIITIIVVILLLFVIVIGRKVIDLFGG